MSNENLYTYDLKLTCENVYRMKDSTYKNIESVRKMIKEFCESELFKEYVGKKIENPASFKLEIEKL